VSLLSGGSRTLRIGVRRVCRLLCLLRGGVGLIGPFAAACAAAIA